VTIVTGTPVAFAGSASLGTTVTATATCSTGKMVGGGAQITGNATANAVAMLSASFPSATATWTVVAAEITHASNGSPPIVTAYALCAT